jgi:hypothetical protein
MGCTQHHVFVNEIAGFEQRYTLSEEKILLDADILFPLKMNFLDDSTIAIAELQDEYAVHIFRVSGDTLHLTDRLGHKGEGPNEIRFNANTLQKDTYNQSEGVWIGDSRWVQFHPYHKEPDTWDDKYAEIKRLPSNLFPATECFIMENDYLLGTSSAIDRQVFLYSLTNDSISEYDFYPVSSNSYNPRDSKNVFSGAMEIKPDKSKFVFAYTFGKALSVVSVQNMSEPMYITFKGAPFPQHVTPQELENLPIQYIRLYTTDNFIYALYAGKMVKDLENAGESQPLSVHVFKWDGTAHCELQLNQLINCLCVDEKTRSLYGINPMAEESSECYRFALPEAMFTD